MGLIVESGTDAHWCASISPVLVKCVAPAWHGANAWHVRGTNSSAMLVRDEAELQSLPVRFLASFADGALKVEQDECSGGELGDSPGIQRDAAQGGPGCREQQVTALAPRSLRSTGSSRTHHCAEERGEKTSLIAASSFQHV